MDQNLMHIVTTPQRRTVHNLRQQGEGWVLEEGWQYVGSLEYHAYPQVRIDVQEPDRHDIALLVGLRRLHWGEYVPSITTELLVRAWPTLQDDCLEQLYSPFEWAMILRNREIAAFKAAGLSEEEATRRSRPFPLAIG